MKTLVLTRPVIAVSGSSGKTTTKEMIASILQTRWKIYKSAANRNNRRHMAQHAQKIKPQHRAVVLEFGMSYPGNLRRSCKIIRPNMAVVTMIGTSHIGNFGGDIKKLIKAKSEIIFHMKQTGILFMNKDDANSRRLNTGKFKGKIVTIAIDNEANYKASNIVFEKQGMSFAVKLDGVEHVFHIPILGEHNIYNALFAIAISDRLGFTPEQMQKGLRNYHRLGGRMRIYRTKTGARVIDDTFNANPNSVKAAIDVLDKIGHEKNIAVLGSMSELGRYARKGHKDVGRYLVKKHVDHLFTYGKGAEMIGKEAINYGFPGQRVTHSTQRKAMHRKLSGSVGAGTTVLVKGSHNMQMKKTVDFLRR